MLLLCCIFTEWSEYSDAVLLSVLDFSMVFMFKIYITVSKSPCYLLKLTFVSFQYLSPFASGVDSPTFQLFHLIGLLHVVELLHLLVEVNHVDLKEFVLNFEAMNSLFWSSKSSFLSVLASATSGSSSRSLSRSTDFYFLKPHVFRRENATKFRAKSKDLNRKLHWNQRLI